MSDTTWSLSMGAATFRWRLDGTSGEFMDALVARLVCAGVHVEAITAGAAYRLIGSAQFLGQAAEEVAKVPGFALAVEQPPTDSIGLSTRPPTPATPRRSIVVHGAGVDAARFVRLAVDHRLLVQADGVCRWCVSGPNATLFKWAAMAWGRSESEVLKSFGLTAADIAAEDSPAPVPTVNVVLPDRKITSEIVRDARGDIRSVVQKETTA